jgi:hypothetical protein
MLMPFDDDVWPGINADYVPNLGYCIYSSVANISFPAYLHPVLFSPVVSHSVTFPPDSPPRSPVPAATSQLQMVPGFELATEESEGVVEWPCHGGGRRRRRMRRSRSFRFMYSRYALERSVCRVACTLQGTVQYSALRKRVEVGRRERRLNASGPKKER